MYSAGHLQRHLQQQGGLADARVAADQHQRAGHHSAAQDAGELADRQRQAVFGIGADLIQPEGRAALPQAARGVLGSRRRGECHDFLDHAVPGAALRAAPHLARADSAALLADELGAGFGHGEIITEGLQFRAETLSIISSGMCFDHVRGMV